MTYEQLKAMGIEVKRGALADGFAEAGREEMVRGAKVSQDRGDGRFGGKPGDAFAKRPIYRRKVEPNPRRTGRRLDLEEAP